MNNFVKVGQMVKIGKKTGVITWIHPEWRFALIERNVNCFGNGVRLRECIHLLHGRIFEGNNTSCTESIENKRIHLPGTGVKRKPWTDEEIKRLNQLLSDGYSIYKISILLDRSYYSVKNKIYFMTGKTVVKND